MSPNLSTPPDHDPLDLYRLRDGIMAADLLAAALVWLDFYTALAKEPGDLAAICSRLAIHPRPTDVLLTMSKAMGLVAERGGVFYVTEKAREFVVAGSPFNVAPYYAAMKDRPATKDMLKVLQTGKPANWGSYDAQAWAQAMERPEFAAQFTAAMDCRGLYLGQKLAAAVDLAGRTALLDIAGGSGIYACAFVARQPHLRATVFEKPPVDRIAREAIEKQGCTGRVAVVAGDLFQEELPIGFDVHLLSNVLHDWDRPVVRDILARSHRALESGGLLIVHDGHLDDDKSGPLGVAIYSALLMNITEGRCYSRAEMRAFFDETGFEWHDSGPTAMDRSYIVARKK